MWQSGRETHVKEDIELPLSTTVTVEGVCRTIFDWRGMWHSGAVWAAAEACCSSLWSQEDLLFGRRCCPSLPEYALRPLMGSRMSQWRQQVIHHLLNICEWLLTLCCFSVNPHPLTFSLCWWHHTHQQCSPGCSLWSNHLLNKSCWLNNKAFWDS